MNWCHSVTQMRESYFIPYPTAVQLFPRSGPQLSSMDTRWNIPSSNGQIPLSCTWQSWTPKTIISCTCVHTPMNAFEEKANVKQKRLKTQTAETGWVLQLELPSSMSFQPMPLKNTSTSNAIRRASILGLPKMTDKERIGAHASRPSQHLATVLATNHD